MGWYFRKRLSFGPLRLNLSKSGIGFTVGRRGIRTGLTSRGQRYNWFSIPGKGIYYRSGGRGCLFMLVLPVLFVLAVTVIFCCRGY